MIIKAIDNTAPFVEKVFVTYSPVPWSKYNAKARASIKNPSNPDLLRMSSHFHKIELLTGTWSSEEEQRNAALVVAKEQGFDYMIIQDADEFYHQEDFKRNLSQIEANPNYAFYTTPWINFWKNTNYVFEFRDPGFGLKNTIYGRCPNFAVNLNTVATFVDKRIIDLKSSFVLSGLCYHMSYVLSDKQMKRKISTWGHSHQVRSDWFANKWLSWEPTMKYLYPLCSVIVNRAVEFNKPVPDQIADFVPGRQEQTKPDALQKIRCLVNDSIDLVRFSWSRFKLKIIRLF